MSYFIDQHGETKGPYTIGQLRSMWHAGTITGDTLYCEEGYAEWLHLRVLADELEQQLQPPRIPQQSVATPPLIPRRRSGAGTRLAVVSMAVVGLVLVFWFIGHLADSRGPHETDEPMAASGIESLPPITVKLNNEFLRVLKMTDGLDALYKRGCSSREFFAAGVPVEEAALRLQSSLPNGDPRRDLLVNTIEAYQKTAYEMRRKEQELSSESLDALIAVAGVRKVLLTKILEGHMTPEDKNLYYVWRKSLTQ
jgi:hypothetical protein